jgi:NAD(P)-dependent dehydrogenase (short-subunit alcohol dehydrogenase family)
VPVSIDLSGQVAWVTGGASGIGAAIVRTLRDAGARVVSLDRSRDASVVLDLTDTAAVMTVVARLLAENLRPDILVNNAGITRDGVVWKLTDEEWDAVLDVNLKSMFRMTRAVVPAMRERGSGAIVNIASINGIRGKFGQSNYAASKGGVIAFTKAVARETGRAGVRVNAIAPGFIETPLTGALPDTVRDAARSEVLLGRLGTPSDIASAVLFLASPLACHITGQVLVVDGGQIA